MNANSTRIDDLPGSDMTLPPVEGMPMPQQPSLPTALQPISTSVHEQGMSSFPQQQIVDSEANIYNPNAFQHTQPMSSDTINQIMSTINVAGHSLPSRDIPMINPHDDQSRPNFIPNNGNKDYIQQYSDFSQMAKHNNNEKSTDLFERLQVPIMCAVIFFLFQLPIVRKSMFKYLPSLYFTDGNPKISALLMQAAVLALGVYLFTTFTQ